MSGIFRLNLSDLLRGGVLALLAAVLTSVQQFMADGGTIYNINWKMTGGVAGAALVAYLLKNLLTDSSGAVAGIAATAPKPPTG